MGNENLRPELEEPLNHVLASIDKWAEKYTGHPLNTPHQIFWEPERVVVYHPFQKAQSFLAKSAKEAGIKYWVEIEPIGRCDSVITFPLKGMFAKITPAKFEKLASHITKVTEKTIPRDQEPRFLSELNSDRGAGKAL